jgi:hypothetical protein
MSSCSGRQTYLGKNLYYPASAGKPEQVETQGKGEVVQEAEESVVVINSQPMKAGNRLEGKTKRTSY